LTKNPVEDGFTNPFRYLPITFVNLRPLQQAIAAVKPPPHTPGQNGSDLHYWW